MLLNTAVVFALIATIGALVLGLSSMARGDDYDLRHGEQYMVARVSLQGIAILFMLIALYFANL